MASVATGVDIKVENKDPTLNDSHDNGSVVNGRKPSVSRGPAGNQDREAAQNSSEIRRMVRRQSTRKEKREYPKYKHVFAIHAQAKPSCLSHDTPKTPSFLGFRNLMVIVLVVGNLRLIVENYMKYGFLIGFSEDGFQRQDVILGALVYSLVPAHLFIAYVVEVLAASQARGAQSQRKKSDAHPVKLRVAWRLIAFAHAINATVCLSVTSAVVYWYINHPMIGTLCETHAIIVWLKQLSYAFTNRDLRDSFLENYPVPEIYASCPYPNNITLKNLVYFWWAPTLVYQPVYPRSASFRPVFFIKRLGEVIALTLAMWFLSAQYAVPVLRNSLQAMDHFDLPAILERLMKLSTVSLVIWLAGFFCIFQSGLNLLAEANHFHSWWNAASVGTYWRTWNRPVYQFMKRHIYAPLLGRGWGAGTASLAVFLFSAVLHEMLVGIPTHNIIGVAFAGMMFQIPLIAITVPLERMRGSASTVGNAIFWISFCLVGQPLAALLYFFAWHVRSRELEAMTANQ